MIRYLLAGITGLVVASGWAECPSTPQVTHFFQTGWGVNHNGDRYQRQTQINPGNVKNLRLKWSYGFATKRPRVAPLVTDDTVFIGDAGYGLVALDRESGCERWVNGQLGDHGTALSHGVIGDRVVLVGASRQGGVYVVDALSGETLWQRKVTDDNPGAMHSGSPLVYEDQIFVPISSIEVGLSANPFYGCCTTSGGMAALDLATGTTNWYRRTIPELPKITGRHWVFIEHHGPSGAPVWNAPTLDEARRLLYFGTGQNYSHPTTATSDAIFAVDIDTGEPRWIAQFTEGDAWNIACGADGPNCPQPTGPDVDFGAPPILAALEDGRQLLLAGQKSGDIWAIDPDSGKTVWHQRIGRGGALGGIHWGMAVDPDQALLFVPISDIEALTTQGEAEPGMFALELRSGEPRWKAPRVQSCEGRQCWSGLSAAITAAPGILVAGALDAQIEVYDAVSGRVIWDYDTSGAFETVNGVAAQGGAIDTHGPVLADNLMIVVSGYGSFGQRSGNAMLVFEVPQ